MVQESVDERAPAVEAQPPDLPSRRLRLLRTGAVVCWLAGLVLYTVFVGIPLDRGAALLWVALGLIAASIGRRRVRTVIFDFLPLTAVLVGYDYLRGLSYRLGMPTHWHVQLDLDKAMFGGHLPSVWLQSHLKYAKPQWWDVPVSLCYISYFVLAVATAGALWLRSRRDFYRWTFRFVPLCLLAFTFFTLTPAAPPWAAARCTNADVAGDPSAPACMFGTPPRVRGHTLIGMFEHVHAGAIPYVQRISTRGLEYLHLTRAQGLLDTGQRTSDLVAAVPSLHSAGVLLFSIFMWKRVRRRYRPLLALYPLAMTFTLVYSGEHYVTDVLLGWLAAVLVSVVAARVEKRLEKRHTESPAQVDVVRVTGQPRSAR